MTKEIVHGRVEMAVSENFLEIVTDLEREDKPFQIRTRSEHWIFDRAWFEAFVALCTKALKAHPKRKTRKKR